MAEVTAMRNNALPYPVYGVAWTVTFPLLDADGDPVSPSSPDSEVSKNGDTFADCTNEATEIASSSGVCYLTLTSTEMTADIVTVRIQSTGAKTTILTLYPRKLPILSTGTCQGSNDTGDIQLASGDSAVDDTYNGCLCVAVIDSTTEARIINDYVGSTKVAEVSPAWNTAQPDSNDTYTIYLPEGRQVATVNSTYFASTSQTARDIGASVLLSNGTGTGQVKLASGYVAMTWADIGSPTTTVNLSGTTVKTATDVETDTADIQTRIPAALGANGNIKADVRDFSGTAGTFASGRPEVNTSHIAGSAVSTSSAQIGVNVVNAGGTAWASGSLTSGVFASGAITATSIASDAITAAKIADGAIDANTFASGAITAAAIAADAIGASELAADAVAEIADAVWDEAMSGHVTSGTFGQRLYAKRTGTAQAGGATTITLDASASSTDDIYNYDLLVITGGTGAGQARYITDYVGSTKVATVATWQTNPSSDSVFVILPGGQIPGATAPTAGEVADAVWDEATSGHTTSGTFGEQAKTDIDSILSRVTTGIPNATAGSANGLLIAGSNAATTFAMLTVTGAFTVSGGVAFNNSSGTAFSVYSSNGLGMHILSDNQTPLVIEAIADTNSIELIRDDDGTGNILGNITGNLSGSAGSVTGAVGSVTGNVGGNVGGNVVGSVASVTGAVGSVTGNVGGNVVGSVASVTTVNDKTGYSLSSSGLDSVSTTAPSGVASNFREMLVQTWRRFFKKTTRDSDEIKTYADNGSTVLTTQTYTASGSDETVNAAS